MVYRPQVDKKRCFVLMPFGGVFDGYYKDIIQPAIDNAGLTAKRSDEIYGTRAIIRDIWDAIWKATVIVADVTGRNPNVNYELGLAHALGVPTILITKALEDVPFDYRHRRVIPYDTNEAGWEQRLRSSLVETLKTVLEGESASDDLPWPYATDHAQRATVVGTLTVEKPREILIRGMSSVRYSVEKAYGPLGTHVSVASGRQRAISCKQGVAIAAGIRSANSLEQRGIDLMRGIADQVRGTVGDGTKTAMLLGDALIQNGQAGLVPEYFSKEFLQGMDRAVGTALSTMSELAKPAESKTLLGVAKSAAGDESLAAQVVEAIDATGNDGIITFQRGETAGVSVEEGMRFDRGYTSPQFVTDPGTQECVLQQCYVLICDRRILSMTDLLPLLEVVAKEGRALLMVAENVEGEAEATLIMNRLRGTLSCVAVRAPGSGERRVALLEDVAILTGGVAVLADVGAEVSAVTIGDLGRAEKVIVGKDSTTILGGGGAPESIARRVDDLRTLIQRSPDPYEKEKLQERITNLVGKFATIHYTGLTPDEMEDQRYRLETALHAARSAAEHGWVPGGGMALLHARQAVSSLEWDSEAQHAGATAVKQALEQPFRKIVESAKQDAAERLDDIRMTSGSSLGFNAETQQVEDLMVAGVLDSAEVVRKSLEVAFSHAQMVLRTDVWDLSEPADVDQSQVGA